MPLSPSRLNEQRQTLFVPYKDFTGFKPMISINKAAIAANTELGLDADAAGFEINNNTIAADLHSFLPVRNASVAHAAGSGGVEEEIGTSALCGFKMISAGEDLAHCMYLPCDWDLRHDVRMRVFWTSRAAAVGARTINWRFGYKPLILDTDAMGVGAASINLTQDVPVGTVDIPQATAYGTIAAGLMQNSNTYADMIWFFIELTSFNGAFTEDKFLLGVEFEYTPNRGSGRQYRRRGRNFRRTTMLS